MPHIDNPAIDEDNALANIIASIALEEAALAHIINAEGEKIQRIVGTFVPEDETEALESNATIEDMQNINTTVGEMIETVSSIETSLHNKLRTVLSVLVVPPRI